MKTKELVQLLEPLTPMESNAGLDLLGFADEVVKNTGYIDKVSFTDAELNEIITQDQPWK